MPTVVTARNAIADPGAFGFSNISDAALAQQHAGGSASDHVFYDDLYPTTSWHEVLADRATQQLAAGSR